MVRHVIETAFGLCLVAGGCQVYDDLPTARRIAFDRDASEGPAGAQASDTSTRGRDAASSWTEARASDAELDASGADARQEADAAEEPEARMDADDDNDAQPSSSCPHGMVEIPTASAPFCIDATEVDNQHYQAFLDAFPTGYPMQPAYCAWNTSLRPADASWPRPGEEAFPVTFIDWCDAFSYCDYQGKRLCGRIGGGPVGDFVASDGSQSQWYSACAGPSSARYPYGDTYDPKACNGVDYDPLVGPRPVGSSPRCQGSAPGLFDMSGNVFEWIDSCTGSAGASDACRVMGGTFGSPQTELACAFRALQPRSFSAMGIGFRCCQDPV